MESNQPVIVTVVMKEICVKKKGKNVEEKKRGVVNHLSSHQSNTSANKEQEICAYLHFIEENAEGPVVDGLVVTTS